MAGGISNTVKSASAGIDNFIEDNFGGFQDTLGDTFGQAGSVFGAEQGGEAAGRSLPRQLVDFLPMLIGAGLAPVTGGASLAIGTGITAGLSGANAYEKTDSLGAAALAGGSAFIAPGIGRAGGQLALKGAAKLSGGRLGGEVAEQGVQRTLAQKVFGQGGVEAGERAATKFADRSLDYIGGNVAANVAFESADWAGSGFSYNPFTADNLFAAAVGELPFAAADAVRAFGPRATPEKVAQADVKTTVKDDVTRKQLKDQAELPDADLEQVANAQTALNVKALEIRNEWSTEKQEALKIEDDDARIAKLDELETYYDTAIKELAELPKNDEFIETFLSQEVDVLADEAFRRASQVEGETRSDGEAKLSEILNDPESFVENVLTQLERPALEDTPELLTYMREIGVAREAAGLPRMKDSDLRAIVEEELENGVPLDEAIDNMVTQVSDEVKQPLRRATVEDQTENLLTAMGDSPAVTVDTLRTTLEDSPESITALDNVIAENPDVVQSGVISRKRLEEVVAAESGPLSGQDASEVSFRQTIDSLGVKYRLDENSRKVVGDYAQRFRDIAPLKDVEFGQIVNDVSTGRVVAGFSSTTTDGLRRIGLGDLPEARNLTPEQLGTVKGLVYAHEAGHMLKDLDAGDGLSARGVRDRDAFVEWSEGTTVQERNELMSMALDAFAPKGLLDVPTVQKMLKNVESPEEFRANLFAAWSMGQTRSGDDLEIGLVNMPTKARGWFKRIADFGARSTRLMREALGLSSVDKTKTELDNVVEMFNGMTRSIRQANKLRADFSKLEGLGRETYKVKDFEFTSDSEAKFAGETFNLASWQDKTGQFTNGSASVASKLVERMEQFAERVPTLKGAAAALFNHQSSVRAATLDAMGQLVGGTTSAGGLKVPNGLQRLSGSWKKSADFKDYRDYKTVTENKTVNKFMSNLMAKDGVVDLDKLQGQERQQWLNLNAEQKGAVRNQLTRHRESVDRVRGMLLKGYHETAIYDTAQLLTSKNPDPAFHEDGLHAARLLNEAAKARRNGDEDAAKAMEAEAAGMVNDTATFLEGLKLAEKSSGRAFQLEDTFKENPGFFSKEGDGMGSKISDVVAEMTAQRAEEVNSLGIDAETKAGMVEDYDIQAELASVVADNPDADMVNLHRQFVSRATQAISNQAMKARLRYELANKNLTGFEGEVAQFKSMVENYMKPDTDIGRFIAKANFGYFMGLNLSSHLLELAQPAFSVLPQMRAEGFGAFEAIKLLKGASKDVVAFNLKNLKGGKSAEDLSGFKDPAERKLMEEAAKHGLINLTHVDDFIGHDTTKSVDDRLFAKNGTVGKVADAALAPAKIFGDISASVYSSFTHYNARLSLLTGFRMARKRNPELKPNNPAHFEKLFDEAQRFSNVTTFSTGRAGRPQALFSGGDSKTWRTVGQGLYSLQSYTGGMLSMMARYAQHGYGKNKFDLTPDQRKAAKSAFKQMSMTMMAAGGVVGMPFVGTIMALIEKNSDLEVNKGLREFITGMFGDDEEAGAAFADIVLRGVGNSFLPADLGSRFAIGGLMGTNDYDGFSLKALAGPTHSLVDNMVKGGRAISKGDFAKGAEEILPIGFKKAVSLAKNDGELIDNQGRKLVNLTPAERMSYLIGFTPSRVRKMRDIQAIQSRSREVASREDTRFLDELALKIEDNPEEVKRKLKEKEQETEGAFSAKAGARQIAKRVQERTFPQDLRQTATGRTGAYESAILQSSQFQQNGAATEMQKYQLEMQLMQSLGFYQAPSRTRIANARAIDQVMAQNPYMTRAEAKRVLQGG